MPARKIPRQLCECCAIFIANNDNSACRTFYGHTHPYPRSEIAGIDIDSATERQEEWTCDGCDRQMLAFATAYDYFRL